MVSFNLFEKSSDIFDSYIIYYIYLTSVLAYGSLFYADHIDSPWHSVLIGCVYSPNLY